MEWPEINQSALTTYQPYKTVFVYHLEPIHALYRSKENPVFPLQILTEFNIIPRFLPTGAPFSRFAGYPVLLLLLLLLLLLQALVVK